MTLEISIEPPPKRTRAKLVPELASGIRREHSFLTLRQLAERYCLTYEGVRQVIRGRCWKGID